MPYKIMWWKDARMIFAEDWDDLDEAVEHVRAKFPLEAGYYISNAVEILDDNHNVVFSIEDDR